MASKELLWELVRRGEAEGRRRGLPAGLGRRLEIEAYEPETPGTVTPEEEKVLAVQEVLRLERQGFVEVGGDWVGPGWVSPPGHAVCEDGSVADGAVEYGLCQRLAVFQRACEELGEVKADVARREMVLRGALEKDLRDDLDGYIDAQGPFAARPAPGSDEMFVALYRVVQSIGYLQDRLAG